MRLRRSIAVLFLVLLPAAAGGAQSAGALTPHIPGWERMFTLEWTPGERHGRPVIRGYLTNRADRSAGHVQLLVDAVDTGGRITAQRVSWLGRTVGSGIRTYFEVPAPPPAQSYRVSVFAFEALFDDEN